MRSLMICSPDIIRVIRSRKMRWAGHVACVCGGGKRSECEVLLGKPEGNRLLGRSRRRLEDNIKMDIR